MSARNTGWHFLWLLTLSAKPCGGIWFLRSDVHGEAGLLFFLVLAAQYRLIMKESSDKMEVIQIGLARRAYKDMTRSVDQIDEMRRWPFGRYK